MISEEYDLTLRVLTEHVGYLLAENDPPSLAQLGRIERLHEVCVLIREARDRDSKAGTHEA